MESLQHGLHRHPHLFRIEDRLQDLLLESCDASVPKFRLAKSAPQKGRRMTFPALAEHANAQPPWIRKPVAGIMAACAGDPSVLREASIEEQALPQSHLLRSQGIGGRSFYHRVTPGCRVVLLAVGKHRAEKRKDGQL